MLLKFISALFGPKTFPVLRADMLKPVDNLITTTDAKRLYREWMLFIGYYSKKDKFDRMELSAAVESLAEDIKTHEEMLREYLQMEKDTLRANMEYAEDAEERKEIREDRQRDIDRAAEELRAFKADKRAWLVDYINSQTQPRE